MRHSLLLLLAVIGCSEKPFELAEHHETAATAFVLESDKTITGKFQPGANTIYLKVHLSEARMLRAELSAVRGSDTRLEIIAENGSAVITADDHGSSLAEEIFPVLLPAGDWFLRISARSDETAVFRFFYRLFKAPADVETEPNNSAEQAGRVTGLHASGFYGPQYAFSGAEKKREQDCFAFSLPAAEKQTAELRLTGVDGVLSQLQLFDDTGEILQAQEAASAGATLSVGPVLLPASGRLTACVSAVRTLPNASRDYYDLNLSLSEVQLKSEAEPNNTPKQAVAISAGSMSGTIADLNDQDYFFWQNKKDYPVFVRAELSGAAVPLLRFAAGTGKEMTVFEGSAIGSEVAENLRVEPGEQLILFIRCNKQCNRKTFKPAAYQIRLSEHQLGDENESEPNGGAAQADTIVDLTQKWGFINPPGDIDFYRLQGDAGAQRKVTVESKLGCRLRLEHIRKNKSLAIATGGSALSYTAELAKDDLLKLSCPGPKAAPPDSSYRLAIAEP